jgi:AcrR family transcriptional regulator
MLTQRADLRATLLEAADRLMRERGARGVTTREIARAAGCSDGALYVHFAGKAQLLSALCERVTPDLHTALGDLVNRVGVASIAVNLENIATIALRVYRDMVPITFAIGGDPELLIHHRTALRAAKRGPRRALEAVAAYLVAEQKLGRVRNDADCRMAANLIIGACWQRAALYHYFGEDILPVDDASYAATLAVTVMRGLEPGEKS